MSNPTDRKRHLNDRAWKTLTDAQNYCDRLVAQVTEATDVYLNTHQLPADDVCFVVVGSVGRCEALAASDVDFTPILRTPQALEQFRPHDQPLRQLLRDKLGMDVSKGEDLTCATALTELVAPETIGGKEDNSNMLTRRILLLTEGRQAGGRFPLDTVQRAVMGAYSGADRSRGRHVLSLCNDVARYYRTLCVEYKAKADDPAKSWCMRNMKLRHSRKFWYFSCMLAVMAVADSNPHGDELYTVGLLEAFARPPWLRLFQAVPETLRGQTGRVVEPFTWFLDFMAIPEHRAGLDAVKHGQRYDMRLDNPFHAVKLNSDSLHQEMLALLDSLPRHQRHRILSWFLL